MRRISGECRQSRRARSMKERSIREVIAHLEAQTKQLREREAWHAQQEAFHHSEQTRLRRSAIPRAGAPRSPLLHPLRRRLPPSLEQREPGRLAVRSALELDLGILAPQEE